MLFTVSLTVTYHITYTDKSDSSNGDYHTHNPSKTYVCRQSYTTVYSAIDPSKTVDSFNNCSLSLISVVVPTVLYKPGSLSLYIMV